MNGGKKRNGDMQTRYSLLIIFLIFSVACAHGQTVRDSLHVLSDTTKTAAKDTSSSKGIDTLVTYSASDSIVYSPVTKIMKMFGKGNLNYRSTKLRAQNIDLDWNSSTILAYGRIDTTKGNIKLDSASLDTIKLKNLGYPVMVDGGEEYVGSRIAYNFKTHRGRIAVAETESGGGFYYAQEIRQMDKDVMYINDGEYTTCDLKHPHYYFASTRMKVIPHDKIVAEPVYFYVEDVPVFVLPFGIFPNERGRRSGILAPTFGQDAQRGWYLGNGGYYWAINDYLDLALRATWYAKGGTMLQSHFNYAQRYEYTGSVSASWANVHTGEPGDPGYSPERDYKIDIIHNQQINPTTRFDVNFSFMSSSYFQHTTTNMNDYLTQSVISNATFSKSWEPSGASMTLNIYREQNLKTGELSMNLPNISFSLPVWYPFRRKGAESGSDQDLSWYEYISLDYNGEAEGQYQKAISTSTVDTTQKFNITNHYGIQHQINISAAPKLGYFTFQPNFSYTEKWYPDNADQYYSSSDSSVKTTKNKGFKAVRTYSMGVSASTQLYGIFPVDLFGIQAFRHKISPSLSYSYSPDFGKSSWGYYGRYLDQNGNQIVYDRYQGQLFGGASNGEEQSISLSIGNLIEAKEMQRDTAKEPAKYQIINFNLSTSYNFAADSLRLSPLGLSYNTNFADIISLSGNTSYTFYQYDTTGRQFHYINKFLMSEGRLARLTNYSTHISAQIASGGRQTSSISGRIPAADSAGVKGTKTDSTKTKSPFGIHIPWNLSVNWDYSYDETNPLASMKSSILGASLSFELTQYWKVETTGSYDVFSNQFAGVTVNVHRDLHCWLMNFNWYPIGTLRGFRLEIKLKAPELQDIKLTKQGGVYSRNQ